MSNRESTGIHSEAMDASRPKRFSPGLALHFGVAMSALDMLANFYHEGRQLEFVHQVIPPALLCGMAAAALHPLLFVVLRFGLSLREADTWPVQTIYTLALGVLFGLLQWGEATPAFYNELLKYLTAGNLIVAALSHFLLSMRVGHGRYSRPAFIAITVCVYLAVGLSLASWFYLPRFETAFGYERTTLIGTAVKLGGLIVFALGLLSLSVVGASGFSRPAKGSSAIRLGLIALPYLVLAVAGWLWLDEYGDSSRIPSVIQTAVRLLPLTAVIAVVSAVALKGERALLVPAASTLALIAVGSLVFYRHELAEPFGLSPYQGKDRKIRRLMLITVDTLRVDVLEPYGGTEIETPHIRELSEDSIVFEEAISSSSWTLPSFSAIFSGLAPGTFGRILPVSRIDGGVDTLAERMADAGYFTGAVGRNPFLRPRHGLDQGFVTHEIYPVEIRARTLGTRLIHSLDPEFYRTDLNSEELAHRGIEWLGDHRSKNFFFWFHFYDPHAPWGPPEPFRPAGEGPASIHEPWDRTQSVRRGEMTLTREEKRWLRELYLQEVRYVDHCLGLLTGALKEMGLYEDTLIVFSSDHGEEFWDHGRLEHGHTLYQELVHVPLMIKMPGQTRRKRVSTPVSTTSITPTCLELAGVGFEAEQLSAPSLAPLCREPRAEVATLPLFSENTFQADRIHDFSVRMGDLKLIVGVDGTGRELYDVDADPAEQEDLSGSHPEAADEGRRLLQAYRQRNRALREFHGIEAVDEAALGSGAIGRLRDLGYL